MANRRMINGEVWEDEFFTALPMFSRLLWIGLITACADDQGRLKDNAALIRSNAFPLDDIKVSDIEAALKAYSEAGKIVRYVAKGKKVIQIINWWKHQTPMWVGKSILPAPDKWIDRERYHGTGNVLIKNNWDMPGGYIADYVASNIPLKDEDDVNDDDNDDDESTARDDYDILQDAIKEITGYPPEGKSAVVAINKLVDMKATRADIENAVQWLNDNGKNARYYSTLVGPTQTAIAIRLQSKQAYQSQNPYEGAKVYK